MDIKQDFKVYCSTNLNEFKKSIGSNFLEENDELILEGIASSTSMDWDGDYMTQECLEDMKSQAVGLSVLQNHDDGLSDIIGKVLEVKESSADLFKIRFSILPHAREFIKELLDNDINLGLSIGAKALDYEPNEDSNSYGWKINKVKLFEISLVSLPANWDSYGSVEISKTFNEEDMITATCFNGACKQLVKNYKLNIKKELEDTNDDEDEIVTHQDCINYVNELGISMYDRLLEQISEEIEKIKSDIFYNNYNTKEDTNNQSTNEEDTNDSSKNEDVKEKKLDMSEIEEKIDTEVQTPTNSIEEEVNEASVEENEFVKSMEKEVKIEKSVDVHEEETVSNEEILKSIKELIGILTAQKEEADVEFTKSFEEKLKQEKENIRKEVEEEIFKELTTERKPVETDQVKVEKKLEEENKEESVETKKSMNTYEIAKMLCNQ